MALRKLGSLIRVSTKSALVGGTGYVYYQAGLWKGTDETIENYDKLKKDIKAKVNSNPDVKKWMEYITSSVGSNIKPYSEAMTNFRKEWLNFDFAVVTRPINGIVKPAWNSSMIWTAEAVGNLPDNIPAWGSTGWQKLQELLAAQPSIGTAPTDKTTLK